MAPVLAAAAAVALWPSGVGAAPYVSTTRESPPIFAAATPARATASPMLNSRSFSPCTEKTATLRGTTPGEGWGCERKARDGVAASEMFATWLRLGSHAELLLSSPLMVVRCLVHPSLGYLVAIGLLLTHKAACPRSAGCVGSRQQNSSSMPKKCR
eukprot:190204-Chlamydomonas_euryale.AAC.8